MFVPNIPAIHSKWSVFEDWDIFQGQFIINVYTYIKHRLFEYLYMAIYIYIYISLRPREVVATLQTFSNLFSYRKSLAFWLIFLSNLFPMIQLATCQHWFVHRLGTEHVLRFFWIIYGLINWSRYGTLDFDEAINVCELHTYCSLFLSASQELPTLIKCVHHNTVVPIWPTTRCDIFEWLTMSTCRKELLFFISDSSKAEIHQLSRNFCLGVRSWSIFSKAASRILQPDCIDKYVVNWSSPNWDFALCIPVYCFRFLLLPMLFLFFSKAHC